MTLKGADRGRPGRSGSLARVVALGSIFLAATASAQTWIGDQQEKAQGQPAKPAWQWTLEERLAARFDPEGMKRRAAREAELAKKTAAQFGERFEISPDQQSIDGKREPELFLPGELFEALLNDGFHHNALHQRESRLRIEERAAVLGFGSDLWSRLEKVAAPFLKLRDERHLRVLAAAARSEELKDSERNGLMICRARAKALEDGKAEFGEQVFLRLLYEAQAPSISFGYQSAEGLPDRLRFMEGGCR